jgi:hypothetical protein
MIAASLPGSALAAPTRRISIADVSVPENNGTASFTVTYSGPNATITVNYATVNGTATAGSDYTASTGVVTLVKGGCKCGTVTVPITNDSMDEAAETFFVNLSNPSAGELGDPQGLGTITDDDAAPTLSIDDVTVSEGDAGTVVATFTMTKAGSTSFTTTVDYTTADVTATAGTDYTAASGTLTFAAGDASEPINVIVKGDVLAEPTETFHVDLSNPTNATIADAQGVGTIQNDEDTPLVTVSDVTVSEAAGTATFTVSISRQSTQTVTVDHATTDGTATAGSDYTSLTGTTTFAPGDSSEQVIVSISDDATYESDEGFTLDLSNVSNATIQDGSGAGTITNDDAAPTFSIDDVTVSEGDAGTTIATFTVTRAGSTALSSTVDYATSDSTAAAPLDYLASNGSLTFGPAATTKSIDVTVNGDVVDEIHETFNVDLSNATNATITDAQGVGTIQNDEDVSLASIDDVSVSETDGTATFTITLSMPNALTVTVHHATTDDTAVGGSDFTVVSGTTTFLPGDTSETVVVPILNDATYEHDESYSIDLSDVTNGLIQDTSGSGSILNEDAAPVLTIDDVSVTEHTGSPVTATFTVTKTGSTEVDALVDWTTVDGTAFAGTDYTAAADTLTFGPGQTTRTINVTVRGDALHEPSESFSITLSEPDDATIGDPTAIGTIFDNDKIPTSLTIKVGKSASTVKAKGLLDPALSGFKVKVTLLHRVGGTFKRVARKTVTVKNLRDRDGDGLDEGHYVAGFAKGTHGTYKFVVEYAGNATYQVATESKVFMV